MCEISPKHTKILRLEFFTSHPMTEAAFLDIVVDKVIGMEMKANEDGRIRCHIHEEEPSHDAVAPGVPEPLGEGQGRS